MNRDHLLTSRRTLLARAIAAAGLPALSGCVKRITFQCIGAVAPPPQPDLVIDAHCHIFNGTDLQVAQFLKRIANLKWDGATSTERVPQAVMDVVANLLEAAVWAEAPNAQDELKLIDSLMKCSDDPVVRQVMAITQLANQQQQAHAKARKSILNSPKMKQSASANDGTPPLSQASTATEANALNEIQQRLAPGTPADFHSLRAEKKRDTEEKKKDAATARHAQTEEALDGVLEYVYQGFQYRVVSVFDYQRTFQNPITDRPSADLMVAAMVDYDWWLAGGKPTRTHLKDQVEVMSRISILTGGQVHGLVPFDPLREVASRAHKGRHAWSSLALVQKAILTHGCIGVKLYPPMGFAPYGNCTLGPNFWSGHGLPEWMDHPISYPHDKSTMDPGDRLDEVLDELYTWCVANDVPLMAHTSASNGTCREFMDLAGSKYWALALNKYPALRISFGHSGDFSDFSAPGYPAESKAFADLMGAAPARGFNAYADAGYFAEILSDTGGTENQLTGWQKLGQQFRDFYFSRKSTDAAPFYSRIMYGTDWSLLLNEGSVATYLRNFRNLFDALEKTPNAPPGLRRRFFGANAAAWLGLKDGATRHRLDKFYADNGLDTAKYPPPWFNKL